MRGFRTPALALITVIAVAITPAAPRAGSLQDIAGDVARGQTPPDGNTVSRAAVLHLAGLPGHDDAH